MHVPRNIALAALVAGAIGLLLVSLSWYRAAPRHCPPTRPANLQTVDDTSPVVTSMTMVVTPLPVGTTEIPIWKTITLGTYKDVPSLRAALQAFEGEKIFNPMLDNPAFTIFHKETKVDLIVVSAGELWSHDPVLIERPSFGGGYDFIVSTKQIYGWAKALGLKLCPPEVGPQLRLQYRDQPRDQQLMVANEPITDADGNLLVFVLDHNQNGHPLLESNAFDPESGYWSMNSGWVFCPSI